MCLAALQATDAGEAFVHKVVDTLPPKPKPAKEAKTGSLSPKIQAAPAPAPPSLAETASAAKKQVHSLQLGLSYFNVMRHWLHDNPAS